jgi:hypothetical protein
VEFDCARDVATYLWNETHLTLSNRTRPLVMSSSPKFLRSSIESGAYMSSLRSQRGTGGTGV